MWRVPTPFVAVWSPSIPVSLILVAMEPSVIHLVNPSATARTTRLEIPSAAAISLPRLWSCASQDPVVAMPNVMWLVIVRNVTVAPVMLVMPTRAVVNQVALPAIPTRVDPMQIVFWQATVKWLASVQKVCLETQHPWLAVMATSARWMQIVQLARLAWASVATIPAPVPADMAPTVVWSNIIRFALVMLDSQVILACVALHWIHPRPILAFPVLVA